MKDKLDRFYTNTDVSNSCVLLLKNILPKRMTSELIIEPSAGSGSFVNALYSNGFSNIIAFDISPKLSTVTEKNFFEVTTTETHNAAIFVGNPPFGVRSCTAKEFIKHCIELGANTIAFILPNTFNKFTMQKIFPGNWRLISITRLPKDSFHMPDGKNYGVPTSFFVWTNRKDLLSEINLREKKYPVPDDWEYVTRNSQNADFCINGNSGILKELNKITNPKAEHFIRCKNRNKEAINNVKHNFVFAYENNLYSAESSVNGGNYWIDRNELNRVYKEVAKIDITSFLDECNEQQL